MNNESKIRHREYIEKLGYTIQDELSDHESNITYFVEQGNPYVMQVNSLFNEAEDIEKMRQSVELLEQMTEAQPGLFLRYYEHKWMESVSKYGTELLVKIEYGYSLEKYLAVNPLTLNDVLQIGIQIAKAVIVCQSYHVDNFIINEKSVFSQGKNDWKLGNFDIGSQQENGVNEHIDRPGMAPEWYQKKISDESSMVYQLGLLLYRLMNGMEMPFAYCSQDEYEAERLRRAGDEPPLPSYGCNSLKKVVQYACASGEKRYDSMVQLKTKLECIQKRLPAEWMETEITGHSYKDEDYIDSNYAEVQDVITTPADDQNRSEDSRQEKEEKQHQELEKRQEYRRREKEKKEEKKRQELAERERKKQLKKAQKKEKKKEIGEDDAEIQSEDEINRKFGKQNKKDLFIIIGIAAAFIAVVAIVVCAVGNSSNYKIYSYIDSAAYGSAMKEMRTIYEKGENLDDIAEAYLDACMNDREYKRIPEGVTMLSEEYCEQHEEKFEAMVREMVENGKEKRAEDLLDSMEDLGGSRAEYALKLRSLITENQ